MSHAYTFRQGEIVPASDSDQFWQDGMELEAALEHHGYYQFPDVELGTDGLCVEVYGVDSPKTPFAEKYCYVANLSFAFTIELVYIPRLGDLTGFLSLTAPLCLAQLKQSAFALAEDKKREVESAKRRVSGQLANRPRR